MLVSKGGKGTAQEGRTKLAPLRTKRVTATFSDGKVRHFEVGVYKSDSFTYGNQMSLLLTNTDNGYELAYDVRYDVRLSRDLSNFDEYAAEFVADTLAGVTKVS